ncbi:Zn-dependent hydrolase [Leptolyngbya sp. AN02str]|uniref:Zn-dependent hydrolase n=1 Tax=Leptolyngbya sp. AN02str TaxID=3423363 RepID=UPI003D315F01
MFVLPKLSVNGDRLNEHIDRLAKVGRQPSGSICRLAFTSEILQARYLIQQWMNEAGMVTRTDAAGNLIGTYEGKVKGAPVLATGSHIDTVPSGGRFDGVLGVLAGIEVARSLHANDVRLNHPIEVIAFTDEENTMIGCQAMAGTVLADQPERYRAVNGQSIQDCLDMIGGNWDTILTARRSRADMAAFVELHVEQGAVLERSKMEIGVVQGVVGIRRKAITIVGEANHAGTTPMDMRRDAMVAAAHVVLAVQQMALRMPTQPVATVGYLTVQPNAVNIVPGRVELSVDIRDLSKECLDTMVQQLEVELQAIATQTDTQIETRPLLCVEPTLAADAVQDAIASVCTDLGLSQCSMPSRAGHDALEIGRITDMGMIFVPSQAGVSHSEEEYTSPEQCTQGANVLLHTLIKLDELYSAN